MHSARRFWALVAAWAAFIFVLSSIPGQSMPHVAVLRFDKLDHAVVYAILGGLCFLAIRRTWPLSRVRLVGIAALMSVLYGLSDEFHQLFVQGRSADLYDVLADGVGGLIGATIGSVLPLFGKPERASGAERAASAETREVG